jgi:hypothetical protein
LANGTHLSRNASADLLVEHQARPGDAGLPWLWKIAQALPLIAAGRNASSNTMFGPLAAEFELYLLEVAGAGLDDAPAGRRAAG